MADTSLGFRFKYRLCGAPPTIQNILSKATGTVTKDDLMSLDTGELLISATNDTLMVGACQETKAVTDSTTYIRIITDSDAVYEVYDANARLIGATLDIAGATGAMTVAASNNVDLIVVANSTAAEPTLVMIAHGEHWLQP